MKDYSNYTATELALDEDFIKWVESGYMDDKSINQWTNWFALHADKKDTVEEAKSIINAIVNEKQYVLDVSKQQEMWSRIENTIAKKQQSKPWTKAIWYAVAASLFLVLFSGIFLLKEDITFDHVVSDNINVLQKEELLKFSNESNMSHALVLEDGSVVTLQPHSSIEYPETFAETQRDVYLSGEAFFEVTRNPQKPFSVYANEIVTRVLGTSFTVRAYEQEKDVVVAVKTGKVSVSTQVTGLQRYYSMQKLTGALLTPNQQIVFSRDESRMVKSLIPEPVTLPHVDEMKDFKFIDTPIMEIFERMEETYGVEIIYDEEVMSNCFLTTSLQNVSFYDKLRLICKGIDAKFEIIDANVIIRGNGCQ